MQKNLYKDNDLLNVRKKHYLPTAVHYYDQAIQITKAKNQYVWDSQNKKYLDAIGGIVCISVGHLHEKIKHSIKSLLDEDMIQHTSYLFLNPYTAEATKKILERSPKNLERVMFTNSGSEANELALMIARNVTASQLIINLSYAYHGSTSQMLNHCGQSHWKFSHQIPGGSLGVPAPYCYRCPFGKEKKSCKLECVQALKNTIETHSSGKIAGMIIEPIIGAGGFIEAPEEYLFEAHKIIKKNKGMFIVDEVQTGSGRTGTNFFYSTHLDLDVDALTTAKGIGNGAPIAAAIFSNSMIENMEQKTYFNTYAGDTYQALQASLTMEIIDEENLIQNADKLGKKLKSGLYHLLEKYETIGDVRGKGLLLGIELVKNKKTKEPAKKICEQVMNICKERGLLLGKGGLYSNVLRIAPPLCINEENINQMLRVLDETFKDLS